MLMSVKVKYGVVNSDELKKGVCYSLYYYKRNPDGTVPAGDSRKEMREKLASLLEEMAGEAPGKKKLHRYQREDGTMISDSTLVIKGENAIKFNELFLRGFYDTLTRLDPNNLNHIYISNLTTDRLKEYVKKVLINPTFFKQLNNSDYRYRKADGTQTYLPERALFKQIYSRLQAFNNKFNGEHLKVHMPSDEGRSADFRAGSILTERKGSDCTKKYTLFVRSQPIDDYCIIKNKNNEDTFLLGHGAVVATRDLKVEPDGFTIKTEDLGKQEFDGVSRSQNLGHLYIQSLLGAVISGLEGFYKQSNARIILVTQDRELVDLLGTDSAFLDRDKYIEEYVEHFHKIASTVERITIFYADPETMDVDCSSFKSCLDMGVNAQQTFIKLEELRKQQAALKKKEDEERELKKTGKKKKK